MQSQKTLHIVAAAWNGFASGCATGLVLSWGGSLLPMFSLNCTGVAKKHWQTALNNGAYTVLRSMALACSSTLQHVPYTVLRQHMPSKVARYTDCCHV